MRVQRAVLTAAMLAWVLSGPSLAGDGPPQPSGFPLSEWGEAEREMLRQPAHYLPREWQRRIAVAPPPDDVATRAELAAMRALIPLRDRRAGEITRQADGAEAEFIDMLRPSPAAGAAALRDLISSVAREAAIIVFHFKEKYARIRPWRLDPTMGTIVPRPQHPAYPSGHATQAMLIALMLADIYPKCGDRLRALGVRIGRNREVAGVHYKSDTDAGFAAARAAWPLIRASQRYRADRAAIEHKVRTVSC